MPCLYTGINQKVYVYLACNTVSKETNSILTYKSDDLQSITQLCRFKKDNIKTSNILLLLHRKCHLFGKNIIINSVYAINRKSREYDFFCYNAINNSYNSQ